MKLVKCDHCGKELREDIGFGGSIVSVDVGNISVQFRFVAIPPPDLCANCRKVLILEAVKELEKETT